METTNIEKMPRDLSEDLSYENIELKHGQKCKIVLDDCCIVGEIYGTFLHWDIEAEEAVFDIGRIGPFTWGKFEIIAMSDNFASWRYQRPMEGDNE